MIKFKVTEKSEKKSFPATLDSINFLTGSFNIVILDDSYRQNRIEQKNALHAIFSAIVI